MQTIVNVLMMAVVKKNIRFLGERSQQHLNQWTEVQLNHLAPRPLLTTVWAVGWVGTTWGHTTGIVTSHEPHPL